VTRVFWRLPSFATVEEAIAHCEAHGLDVPVLHSAPFAPVLGMAELAAEAGRLERRARDFEALCEASRP
jgi:hypothetical protein